MRRKIIPVLVMLAVWAAASPAVAQKTQRLSVDGLLYDLRHPDSFRRVEAVRVLGQEQIHQAVPGLVALSEDPEVDVRLETVRALRRLRDQRALPAYIRLVGDSEKEIQERAIDGIVELYVPETGGLVGGIRRLNRRVNPFADDFDPRMVEPYVIVEPQATSALAGSLDSPRVGVRKKAALALGILRAYPEVNALQVRLEEEESEEVRVELIRAIFKIGDSDAARSLIPLIRDPSKKVHDEAIYALGRLRVAAAVPALKDLYASGVEERRKILGVVPVSGSDDLQKNLYQALSFIGDPSCAQLFIAGLEDPREFYRRHGAEGLARIGDPQYASHASEALAGEESASVRSALDFALYRMGHESRLRNLVFSDREQDLSYLLELEPSEIRQLYPYLSEANEPLTLRVLEVIGLRGDESALAEIEPLMSARSARLASAANLAVRRLRGVSSYE